ncbi:T9SS type A sorting domain-containing protein [candidate division WOR-3 bacterium]|uniref:T9SS type A sorting domain-containing protein n=1 Tax=candidate division WOR-3 bacterium TaxID=2052148 RepID=A0A9D5K7G2_UNCW3|nr:T9SS type A sorting domain-containing protein [candidate division WOR-3 bacterium]MBD3363662.1 T9SS type A sorting domain-containing protein [candidate division WOR-3 bacterium]
MSRKIFTLFLLLGFSVAAIAAGFETPTQTWAESGSGGRVGWIKSMTSATGWYWSYDVDAEYPNGLPFKEPVVPDLYTVFPALEDTDNTGALKLEPYNDRPYKLELEDSFYFFQQWYVPGDHIYISPDGWLSFDESSEDGFANPPDANPPIPNTGDPNELIAVLWQDNDPTLDDDPSDVNRIYYQWPGSNLSDSLRSPRLVVQWHEVEAVGTGETYDFACALQFGGQTKLIIAGDCGPVFSYHFIECYYRMDGTSAPGDDWSHDNGVIGVEGQSGEYGLTYPNDAGRIDPVSPPPGAPPGSEGAWVIRFGYKKLFRHDVAADLILSPGPITLRWTPIEPILVVANAGLEVEHFNAIYQVWQTGPSVENDDFQEGDSAEKVYESVLGSYDLFPYHGDPDDTYKDTIEAPCWTPEGYLAEYEQRLIVDLDGDMCNWNDTFKLATIVECNDTFRYDWNWSNVGDAWGNAEVDWYHGMWYKSDNGVLVTGARVYLAEVHPECGWEGPALSVWEAEDGCGPADTDNPIAKGKSQTETYQVGWNNAHFGYYIEDAGEYTGVFAKAAPDGNIFVAFSGYSTTSGTMQSIGHNNYQEPHNCYDNGGSYPSTRSCWWNWDWPSSGFYWGHMQYAFDACSWVVKTYQYSFSYPMEMFVHLGFGPYPQSPKPQHPCYHDEPHDLTAYRFEKPFVNWVEADVPLTVEIALANLGRQTEPDAEFFTSKFFAVNLLDNDTIWTETTLFNNIGWLGDPDDGLDTVLAPFTPFDPEGACLDWQEMEGYVLPSEDKQGNLNFVGVPYEFIGLVRLGEVGPDLSDHCPLNDTTRIWVTCLLSHDVGVVEMINEEGNDWSADYPAGTEFTCIATVENFGFNEEHDVITDLEIYDISPDPDSLVWHNSQSVEHLDWRGNQLDQPYWAEVEFPKWTSPSENAYRLTCRTELPGDVCPVNDEVTRYINPLTVTEGPVGRPFALEAIKPNPIVGSAKIYFSVPHSTNVSLKIYDISGKLVATLVDGNRKPGRHNITWNGTDNTGRSVAQGIYLVRMDSETFSATKKVVLY